VTRRQCEQLVKITAAEITFFSYFFLRQIVFATEQIADQLRIVTKAVLICALMTLYGSA
jgi:hypothetical protein